MRDFDAWFRETTERILAPKKPAERELTEEAQADRDDF